MASTLAWLRRMRSEASALLMMLRMENPTAALREAR
jgi:hypothetical protein